MIFLGQMNDDYIIPDFHMFGVTRVEMTIFDCGQEIDIVLSDAALVLSSRCCATHDVTLLNKPTEAQMELWLRLFLGVTIYLCCVPSSPLTSDEMELNVLCRSERGPEHFGANGWLVLPMQVVIICQSAASLSEPPCLFQIIVKIRTPSL